MRGYCEVKGDYYYKGVEDRLYHRERLKMLYKKKISSAYSLKIRFLKKMHF